jgi:hypothetical protein
MLHDLDSKIKVPTLPQYQLIKQSPRFQGQHVEQSNTVVKPAHAQMDAKPVQAQTDSKLTQVK